MKQQQLKIIQDEMVGIVTVKEDSQLNKIAADKVIIDENVTARLFGSVKTIILKKGAKLFFHGIISGDIKNSGGEIFIFSK